MSRFFIDRPVFAWVIGLVIMLVGGVEIFQLPIAQYPSIAAPQIAITVTYPGASAETVESTVVRPILQEMSGLDGLEYISSATQADGSMEIDLTFTQATDPNIAQVQVQNKLSLAEASLPTEVTAQGIKVQKSTKNFMMVASFISTDHSMDDADISDYIASKIQDPLTRISGVGDYTLLGTEYAMRIWLDPDKLYRYALTVGDVVTAIEAQNIQVSSGEIGGQPARRGQRLDATIIGPSRMTSPEEFRNILLKVNQNGSQVRLKDVSTVELGRQVYGITGEYNGTPSAGIALKLTPGGNLLATEAQIKSEIQRLSAYFPSGLQVVYPYDTEPFVALSIQEVVKTLIEAIVLVFVVMLVFLQNVRATLIPTIAVPVVLLGTFGVLAACGYSINTLTMLAMVLAVGLLVDDAIVVVENVERVMRERRLSPREAARQSMDEIQGALVGIALVLSAVFLPMAFFGGSTGVIYRQFSITIVSAMALSVIVALVLTPALCATLLKPHQAGPNGARRLLPVRYFNIGFEKLRRSYGRGVSGMVAHSRASLVAFALITAGVGYLFTMMPTGFLPDEDQAILFCMVSLPPGSSLEQTIDATREVSAYLRTEEKAGVESVQAVNGFSFAGRGQNSGMFFVRLRDWSLRKDPSQSAAAIAGRVMAHYAANRQERVVIFSPPPVNELGSATGFDFELQDAGDVGYEKLLAARNQLLGMAAQDPLLMAVRPNGLEDAPQYRLQVDREKADALGVSIADINTTIQGALGSTYVNQFMRGGRVKQVYVQGEADARMLPSDLGRWYVRNASGGMVPFNSFLSGRWTTGPQKLENYNGLTSFEILGQPAPGVSSGTAMAEMEKLAAKLPPGIGYQWTGISYEQKQAGTQTGALYAISIIIVLFCLAALYESWPVPFSVLMVVPLGVVGAMLATFGRGLDNDVYFQVGLLTTVGLAVKNAILIVEFAKSYFDTGRSLRDAAMQAAFERLRPILMTSLAFVFGSMPLAIASGAGASARIAIGTAVVGGMVSATLLAIFFVPVFFVVVLKLFKVRPSSLKTAASPADSWKAGIDA